jgi:hypothetical protein
MSIAWEAGTYMFIGMLATAYLDGTLAQAERPAGSDVPRYETLAGARLATDA